MSTAPNLAEVIKGLRNRYGSPSPQIEAAPWPLVVWERVTYLTTDKVRAQAFETLQRTVGLAPAEILGADRELLVSVCGGPGGFSAQCARNLREAAELVEAEFDGNLSQILGWPLEKAKRALMKFRGIGVPGAEKILLFTGAHPFLALESNGLRVLTRIGFGAEHRNYAVWYKAVQSAAERTIDADFEPRIEAYHLLRQHGMECCRRATPDFDTCPVQHLCGYSARFGLR